MRDLLQERDKARDDGDTLATAVLAFLKGRLDECDLALALMGYCEGQGWNGPAATFVHDLIDHQQDGGNNG